jgi:hypothetical protein
VEFHATNAAMALFHAFCCFFHSFSPFTTSPRVFFIHMTDDCCRDTLYCWMIRSKHKKSTHAAMTSMSYHVPHHIIFLLVANYDSHIRVITVHVQPLIENPFTFLTNTCHPLQRSHLSFSTKKDCTSWCIFSRNTVVNIDVALCLPVCHITT